MRTRWRYRRGAAEMVYLFGLLVLVAGFVLWLAAPMTWRGGEGSVEDDGENFAAWLRRLRWW